MTTRRVVARYSQVGIQVDLHDPIGDGLGVLFFGRAGTAMEHQVDRFFTLTADLVLHESLVLAQEFWMELYVPRLVHAVLASVGQLWISSQIPDLHIPHSQSLRQCCGEISDCQAPDETDIWRSPEVWRNRRQRLVDVEDFKTSVITLKESEHSSTDCLLVECRASYSAEE